MRKRRVRLDRVDELEIGGQRGDRATDGRDDADGERVGVPERAADRGDRLADDDAGRVAERERRERVRRGLTRRTPTSSKTSQPTIRAGTRSWSANST